MVWLVALLCAVSAALHLRFVVPALQEPELEDGEPAPRYATLAPGRHVALLGVTVLALSQVLHVIPTERFGVWFGFLGVGAALVWVDLRTTWLPRSLHRVCLAQVLLGSAWLAVLDWPTAAASLVGGAVAFLLFHLVWRFSSSFGYGDVRLAGVVGAVGALGGVEGWLAALLCGTALGALWGVAHALARRGTDRPAHFAYGPALWLGPIAAAAISGWWP